MTVKYQSLPCLICGAQLDVRTARGRKSGKPFITLVCPKDGRHFRGFISNRDFVTQVLDRLEGQTPDVEGGGDLSTSDLPSSRSKTNLERVSES